MRARVENGRWVLDEPADLPEGTIVEIVTRVVQATGAAPDVHLDDALLAYIRALLVAAGGSAPQAESELAQNAKSAAARANRRYVTPDDIKKSPPDVLRRFIVVPSADLRSDDVIARILDITPVS